MLKNFAIPGLQDPATPNADARVVLEDASKPLVLFRWPQGTLPEPVKSVLTTADDRRLVFADPSGARIVWESAADGGIVCSIRLGLPDGLPEGDYRLHLGSRSLVDREVRTVSVPRSPWTTQRQLETIHTWDPVSGEPYDSGGYPPSFESGRAAIPVDATSLDVVFSAAWDMAPIVAAFVVWDGEGAAPPENPSVDAVDAADVSGFHAALASAPAEEGWSLVWIATASPGS